MLNVHLYVSTCLQDLTAIKLLGTFYLLVILLFTVVNLRKEELLAKTSGLETILELCDKEYAEAEK